MNASDLPAYVDSSLPLAVLLGQAHASLAAALWDAHPRRVSSLLLEAECRTVLRRAARSAPGRLPDGWLVDRERLLDSWLLGIHLRTIDRAVAERLAAEPGLGACRTLDAVHLATALLLRDHLGSGLVLCTFDLEQAAAARELGFVVRGAPESGG
jgi:predicted nucleic acid-binding protein